MQPNSQLRSAFVIGALGVVFGDIGTSPIYTIQTLFDPHDPHPVSLSRDNIYGVAGELLAAEPVGPRLGDQG